MDTDSASPVARVAALYDIHGNLPALEAVLEDVAHEHIDAIVIGGDVVPGPMPRESLERVHALDVPTWFILGNGESAVLDQMAGREPLSVPARVRPVIRWVAGQMAHGDAARLSWPATVTLPVRDVGDVLFCHATPHSNTMTFTRRTSDARVLALFSDVRAPLVVCGHTHMPFDRTIGTLRIVNAGSVGMPFGEPGAYWALIGPRVELRRTAYDVTRAAERVKATSYPDAAAFAERNILRPPSERDMLEVFRRVEEAESR